MPDDARALSALAFRSKAHWGYSPQFMQSCKSELTYRPHQIADKKFSFAIAQDGQETVGFYGLARTTAQRFELDALFVEPSHIGRGVGRQLIKHAIELAAAELATSILIQGDPNAEKFYLAAGAIRIGDRESASIPGRSLPLFEICVNER